MQSTDTPEITWDNWAAEAERLGVRYETIAVLTGKSYISVYKYATGARSPRNRDAWLAKVVAVLRMKALEQERIA